MIRLMALAVCSGLLFFGSTNSALAQSAETNLNKGSVAPKPDQLDLAVEFAREDFNSLTVISLSKLFTYTNFYSPTLHLKVEGNLSFVDSDFSDVYASVLGAGVAYFFTDNWSLTTYLRGGGERDNKSDTDTRVLGIDATNEIYFSIDNDNVVSIENKLGAIEYKSYYSGSDETSSNRFAYTENYVGLDLLASKEGLFSQNEHARIKITGGVEHKFGDEDSVKTIYDAIISLRTVDATSGIDKVKFELRGSVGDQDYRRAIAGITVTY